jgi:hypothetical protein
MFCRRCARKKTTAVKQITKLKNLTQAQRNLYLYKGIALNIKVSSFRIVYFTAVAPMYFNNQLNIT